MPVAGRTHERSVTYTVSQGDVGSEIGGQALHYRGAVALCREYQRRHASPCGRRKVGIEAGDGYQVLYDGGTVQLGCSKAEALSPM